MKIRNGFISNSSSSSFIAIGVWLEDNTSIEDIYKKVFPNSENLPQCKDKWELVDYLDGHETNDGISIHYGSYWQNELNDKIFVGYYKDIDMNGDYGVESVNIINVKDSLEKIGFSTENLMSTSGTYAS